MTRRRILCRLARPALRGRASLSRTTARLAAAALLGLLSAGAAAGQQVNACTLQTATDWLELGPGQREMTFGCPPFPCRYTPPCVKIKPGRTVRWLGEFEFHPLRPGLVVGAGTQNQPGNPIPILNAGTNSGLISFPQPGAWGFYCNFHFQSDAMKGAVFVATFADGFETGNTGEWSSVHQLGEPEAASGGRQTDGDGESVRVEPAAQGGVDVVAARTLDAGPGPVGRLER
jgi:plastocyanin